MRIPAPIRLAEGVKSVEIERHGSVIMIFNPADVTRQRKALRKIGRAKPMKEEWPRP